MTTKQKWLAALLIVVIIIVALYDFGWIRVYSYPVYSTYSEADLDNQVAGAGGGSALHTSGSVPQASTHSNGGACLGGFCVGGGLSRVFLSWTTGQNPPTPPPPQTSVKKQPPSYANGTAPIEDVGSKSGGSGEGNTSGASTGAGSVAGNGVGPNSYGEQRTGTITVIEIGPSDSSYGSGVSGGCGLAAGCDAGSPRLNDD